jgi:hypothetical protein
VRRLINISSKKVVKNTDKDKETNFLSIEEHAPHLVQQTTSNNDDCLADNSATVHMTFMTTEIIL